MSSACAGLRPLWTSASAVAIWVKASGVKTSVICRPVRVSGDGPTALPWRPMASWQSRSASAGLSSTRRRWSSRTKRGVGSASRTCPWSADRPAAEVVLSGTAMSGVQTVPSGMTSGDVPILSRVPFSPDRPAQTSGVSPIISPLQTTMRGQGHATTGHHSAQCDVSDCGTGLGPV